MEKWLFNNLFIAYLWIEAPYTKPRLWMYWLQRPEKRKRRSLAELSEPQVDLDEFE